MPISINSTVAELIEDMSHKKMIATGDAVFGNEGRFLGAVFVVADEAMADLLSRTLILLVKKAKQNANNQQHRMN